MKNNKNTIYYLGHASLRICTADNKVIYVDPFAGTSEDYSYAADLILETHSHSDHSDLSKVRCRRENCRIITEKEAIVDGKYQTFDMGFVVVEALKAENANHKKTECVGYLLTFINGKKIYISGDTSHNDQMKCLAARNIDIGFFCCDGVFNMDVAEASKCAREINPIHSIPYHTCPPKAGYFNEKNAIAFDGPGKIILRPGDSLDF
jgi:L-ascorbate metabolism protein UlaG (beta-lactamase superfamily)